ncbi:MAG TPA: 7-cyano-7-deazaguanine synthase QueC [Gemmatimonadales bacterium]|nr:7-cyano-7-deazaguanine synthase QueC [Gemmatimonadales bacterium]
MGGGRPAIVLLSGGLDSATTLAVAKSEGYTLHALSFRYGQRHAVELDAARAVARQLGVARHEVVEIDLRSVGGSALTADIPVPMDRSDRQIRTGIPATYVPARNTIFLSFALAWCEVLEAADIFIGVNALDYSGYPDCRPEFIRGFETLANLATRASVEGGLRYQVHAPLIALTKAEIIRKGQELGVDYSLTRSCYAPDESGRACGRCDACRLRLRGFAEAGVPDPGPYQGRS